jgi:hypothetical protein
MLTLAGVRLRPLWNAVRRMPKSFATSKETRRMWRRQQERAQRYAA